MGTEEKLALRTIVGRKIRGYVKKKLKYVEYKWILPAVYTWYARKPVNEELVIFADHRNRNMPDNFQGLYKLCTENGFTCEFLSGKSCAPTLPKWTRRKEKLIFHFKFIRLFAQCRVLFLVEHFPLADVVTPRKETQVVQLWHGCGLMKKCGYAVTSGKWGLSEKEKRMFPMHISLTLSTVSSSSPVVKAGYQAIFNCAPDIIKPLGSPRTDIYFSEDFKQKAQEKVRGSFPQIGERKIILYAPTFRGRSIGTSFIELDLDFQALKNALSDRYVFLTKFHPLMAHGGLTDADHLEGGDFLFDATTLLSPEEALCAADILITDYSSIIFEFMLLERPIISYIYDIDTYDADRGLFHPYDQLAPGPYVYTKEELLEKLLTVDDWFDIERVRAYKEEFMSACDGHSTQRIYDYVFHQHDKNEELQTK